MIPYVPTKQPMTGEEQEVIMDILQYQMVWNTRPDRLRIANRIINAGFHRTVPRKVTKTQLWSYALETVGLAYAAWVVMGLDRPFVYGMLAAFALGSLLTFIGALVINHGIKEAKS